MPNRIIKESICTSASMEVLSWFEEALFTRLIVNADDYGRFDGRCKVLKARCFPLKDVEESLILQGLESLEQAGIIEIYNVNGLPYIQIINWGKHQSIRSKRSKYPSPHESNCMQMLSDAAVIQSESENESEFESESESKESRKRFSVITNNTAVIDTNNQDFEEIWADYPNKKGKTEAKKAFETAISQGVKLNEIRTGLDNYNKYINLRNIGERFIKHGSTWFSSQAWNDCYDLVSADLPRGAPATKTKTILSTTAEWTPKEAYFND